MEPVTAAIRPLHLSKVWDDISPQFLATFWSLTMYDLFVPENIYTKEIAKKRQEITKVEDNRELNNTRKKKEKERISTTIDKMTEEQKRQKDHVEKVMARLKKEKDSWFFSRSAKLAKNETITTFLQLCLPSVPSEMCLDSSRLDPLHTQSKSCLKSLQPLTSLS